MQILEESLQNWRKEEVEKTLKEVEQQILELTEEDEIMKQGIAAQAFSVSVNTLKEWIKQGCPEIRLESGMLLYSKKSIRNWLLQHQK